MALSETRVLFLRDADMNTSVIVEQDGELRSYTYVEFLLLMAKSHLNEYIIADVSASVVNDDDPMTTPFGCEEEASAARESWGRLTHYDEYLQPMSGSSKNIFMGDFDSIYKLADREGLVLGG